MRWSARGTHPRTSWRFSSASRAYAKGEVHPILDRRGQPLPKSRGPLRHERVLPAEVVY